MRSSRSAADDSLWPKILERLALDQERRIVELEAELSSLPTNEEVQAVIAESAAQWERAEALQIELNVERDARERAQAQTIRLQDRLHGQ